MTAKKKAMPKHDSRKFKPSRNDLADAPQRMKAILSGLKKLFPDAGCFLNHKDPLQLLVATILSAQCTDKQVNTVTPNLFKHYKTAADFAAADGDQLESLIHSTGFFRNKAKNIQAACAALLAEHDGQVPADRDLLVQLPGVGRKTANVVLGDAFDIPSITTDTHVIRLSRLWGVSDKTDPVKLEFDLMDLVPEKRRTWFSHATILHGRNTCMAGRPHCDDCSLRRWCAFGRLSI